MNLQYIRNQFLKASGRHDLVNSDGSDNGADFFINAGQRMLDRMCDLPALNATASFDLRAGEYYLLVEDSRVVKEVWIYNTDHGRRRLDKAEEAYCWQEYPVIMSALKTQRPELIRNAGATYSGTPLLYAVFPHAISPVQQELWRTSNFITRAGLEGRTLGNLFNHTGILILPPTSEPFTVLVQGLFYSKKLLSPGDVTFWTQEAPEVLVHAAMYQLETFYRNMEGAGGWMQAIRLAVSDLDLDSAGEDAAEINQIGG